MDLDGDGFLPRTAMTHLLVEHDGICWWCRSRPATTGEHKFKASDLVRLMGDDTLIWGDREGNTREIRGKSGIRRDRYGVVKFPKSMCDICNNSRSQPFDLAYEQFSNYLIEHRNLRFLPGIALVDIFGEQWRSLGLDLARYYAKHFGCQMVRTGVGAPDSLREFMDGALDISDAHMALVTTDSVNSTMLKNGLSISAGAVFADRQFTQITGCVFAAYVGSIGVRFEWQKAGLPDGERSQFFHYPVPVLNFFTDEVAVVRGVSRRPGKIARFLQWVNTPSGNRTAE